MLDPNQTSLEVLKNDFSQFPKSEQSLEMIFESIVKHLASYKKIIEPHIQDLETVLQSGEHQHKTLEDVSLPEPIQQLQQILKNLSPTDLKLCEDLLLSTQNMTDPESTA